MKSETRVDQSVARLFMLPSNPTQSSTLDIPGMFNLIEIYARCSMFLTSKLINSFSFLALSSMRKAIVESIRAKSFAEKPAKLA
jgi:hypothetical protein